MTKLPIKKQNKSRVGKGKAPIRLSGSNVKRIQKLVDSMLQTLEEEWEEPESSELWRRWFGTKDSAVVTLQKLVQLLAAISDEPASGEEELLPSERFTREEMKMLSEWLGEKSEKISAMQPQHRS